MRVQFYGKIVTCLYLTFRFSQVQRAGQVTFHPPHVPFNSGIHSQKRSWDWSKTRVSHSVSAPCLRLVFNKYPVACLCIHTLQASCLLQLLHNPRHSSLCRWTFGVSLEGWLWDLKPHSPSHPEMQAHVCRPLRGNILGGEGDAFGCKFVFSKFGCWAIRVRTTQCEQSTPGCNLWDVVKQRAGTEAHI